MKRLFDAFLELPTWQGCALIAGFVAFVTVVALVVSYFSFRAGLRYADRDKILIATNPRVWRSHPASRISDHVSRFP